jgi:MFS transporter, YNFM family, putative membrane transport protein
MRRLPTVPIMLAGFAAFLDLYATQPLLPLLTRTFEASNLAVSLTITAPTIAVAAAAPFVGRLADRIGLRRVIVGSAFALAIATALAATSANLTQLIGWRFVQGLFTPGIFAVAMAYIHHEWPTERIGRATSAYISGTVMGGFTGRAVAGMTAAAATWRTAFVALAVLNLVVAIVLWAQLPVERHTAAPERSREGSVGMHLRNPQLIATYAVGFCILCAQVAMFTYVPFPLSAPPFNLSTVALGWLFAVYLLGAIVTPLAGHWIDRYGHRTGLTLAVGLGVTGALMTIAHSLPLVIAGLAIFATAVFIAQSSATSHVGAHAHHDRGLAIGLYSTFYYLGGSTGGAVPALAWNRAGWLGCVALVVFVQLMTLAIALTTWSKRPGPHVEPAPA